MSRTVWLFAGAALVLIVASAIGAVLKWRVARGQPHGSIDNLNARIRAWWAMVALLGLAFAFGWTPCIGPLLGTILSLAATDADATRGTALLAVYALGLGIPFLLSAIFINRAIGLMNRIKPHMKTIERVMGVLLIAVGLMLVSGRMADLSYWMLETFPGLATLG